MKQFLSLFTISFLFVSCVSESDHQKIIDERNELFSENQILKNELDEIKYGAPNLFSDGIKFYKAKNFSQAKEKFQTLVQKHPDMPQSIEANKYLLSIDEEEFWHKASTSEDIDQLDDYISKYPKGKYVKNAVTKKNELKRINMQNAYNDALSLNNSYTWKQFLENYPDHPHKNSIKEKIIRLEVDEILGDKRTGEMPNFNHISSSYSTNSSVEIKNNTGCSLTVRYSGPEAKIIEIPTGGTRTINLISGQYKIAATACNENYAGTENLNGSYNSTFYIRTYRY